jgi:protein SCO1/2
LLVGLAALAVGATGCRGGARAPLRRYALHGVVVAVEPDARRVTVQHDDIAGFMPAMTMPYQVKEPYQELRALRPRDTITAEVVAQGTDVWLEHIVRQPGAH